jgi:hypothetical protein
METHMFRSFGLAVALAGLALVYLGGCGGPRAERSVTVSGTVNLDGQPLKEGEISFVPDPNDGKPPGVAKVSDGKFSGPSRPGKKKVEIHSRQPTGKKLSTGEPVMEDKIPAKYNTNTTLTADVTESGPNEFTFDLKK